MRLDTGEIKKIREEFMRLMDEEHPEQIYQKYMEDNTALIPREFVQNHGIHFDMVFRKISLARDYAPDFFTCQKVLQIGISF